MTAGHVARLSGGLTPGFYGLAECKAEGCPVVVSEGQQAARVYLDAFDAAHEVKS